jgi:hypothetical protein
VGKKIAGFAGQAGNVINVITKMLKKTNAMSVKGRGFVLTATDRERLKKKLNFKRAIPYVDIFC